MHALKVPPLDKIKLLKALAYQEIAEPLAEQLITEVELVLKGDSSSSLGFLEPYECIAISSAIQGSAAPVTCVFHGGYSEAKRKRPQFAIKDTTSIKKGERISIRDDMKKKQLEAATPLIVTAISIEGKCKEKNVDLTVDAIRTAFKSCTTEEQIGDILIRSRDEVQVIITTELLQAWGSDTSNCPLKAINDVPIMIKPVDLRMTPVRPPAATPKQVVLVENTLRLDAIASAGFGMSRNQITKHIANGLISVDDKPVLSATAKLRSGTVLTFQDKATFSIDTIDNTSKGKFRISGTRAKFDLRR